LGACGSSAPPARLDAEMLRDPAACQSCHPTQFAEWSGSMHAQAADDPLFLAMNKRAQRETVGALGTFCVNCHAPLAVREGLTTDGLNLASLPATKKGVTCYFCHAVESLGGTHDNPLVLATDDSLFGPFGDPAPTTPHAARTSTLFDDTQTDSATMCGSCHDIVNQHGAHVERTFEEWQASLFSQPMKGLSCQQCHMDGSDGPASTVSTGTRRVHRHDFPAVDLALATGAATDALRARSQTLLDSSVQSTLCWNPVTSQIEVTLDNVGAGHGWPSGATPDRRGWLEVTAYAGPDTIYSSGGAAAAPLEGSTDPDLWLMRDCLFDEAGAETSLFWQAARVTDDQLPGALSANVTDPASFMGHRQRTFPAATGAGLAKMPDRITLQLHLQAVGDDVLTALVTSGDLDPSLPPLVARYEVAGAALEWTSAKATPQMNGKNGLLEPCVFTGRYNANVTPADSHAKCAP
jgi:Cytochrome c554 and c-prime